MTTRVDAACTCPVCGYPDLDASLWTDEGGGSYEICSSCGFQFGVTDDDRGYTYESWRADWINRGMRWRDTYNPPPSDWDPRAQLGRLLRGGS